MPINALLAPCLSDPTAAARRHHQTGRVIGYAGGEIPVELIVAAGAMPLRVAERPDLCTTNAERYLEASFTPTSLTLVEQYLAGQLDFLDALILPRSNDSLQRVYYYLCELQRRGDTHGPRLLMYDQAKIARHTSAQHNLTQTELLARELGSDLKQLPICIATRNARRDWLARAKAQRQQGLSATELHVMAQVADWLSADEFATLQRVWQPTITATSVPVLLAGSAPPDERIHQAIESAGGNVVAELNEAATNLLDTTLIPEPGGLTAVSEHYRHYAGQRAFVDRARQLSQLIASCKPVAVIHWLIEQDETLVWSLPQELAVARAAQLPTLTLTRRTWRADDGALDAIVQFVSQLRQRA